MRTEPAPDALADCILRFEEALRDIALRAALSILRDEALGQGPRRRGRPRKAQIAAPPVPPPPPVAAPPEKVGRKPAWTREAIIDELVTLLRGKTTIDAAFVTRHGPRGLAAAARKTFGRFDAALNVAGLRLSQLYPDGPPGRRSR